MTVKTNPSGGRDDGFARMMREITSSLTPDPGFDAVIRGPILGGARMGTSDKQAGSSDNELMEYVPRPELDAKLETIEARMDGRIARIEDNIVHIRHAMESQKNAVWYAAATIIATFIAVFAVYVTAFDSGRDTAKLAADAQQQTATALTEMRQLVERLKPSVN